jgi:hypothetical protein
MAPQEEKDRYYKNCKSSVDLWAWSEWSGYAGYPNRIAVGLCEEVGARRDRPFGRIGRNPNGAKAEAASYLTRRDAAPTAIATSSN